jgi:nucleoside phosphorylase
MSSTPGAVVRPTRNYALLGRTIVLVYVRQVDVDIVVLTVVIPELAAARKVFRTKGPVKISDGTVWYPGKLKSKLLNRDYSIALVCIGQAGNPTAAIACQSAITIFRPKAIFIVGIAGGYRAKTKIGEVIFSDRIVSYESQAIVGTRSKIKREPRYDTERSPYTIMQDLSGWLADDKREPRMKKQFAKSGGTVPRAKKGQAKEFKSCVSLPVMTRQSTLASGEKLVKNPTFFTVLRKVHGKIEAVEMEAVGLTEACRKANVPWLVVRGISDFGDKFKNDDFHKYASSTASVALVDFICNALMLGPESPPLQPFKAKPSLSLICSRLTAKVTGAIPRTVFAAGDIPKQLVNTPLGFVPGDGECFLLSGPSGRGKTTALNLIAIAAATSKTARYPLFVRPVGSSSIIELLRGSMNLPEGTDDLSIQSWFEKTPTLILVDDWHLVAEGERLHFEHIVQSLPRAKCGIVIASAGNVSSPRISELRQLRILPLTKVEQEQIVNEFLHNQHAFSHLRKELPPRLVDLFGEPVLLAKFLEMVRRTRTGGTKLPHDLPGVFRQLLVALMSIKHPDGPTRADEVTAVLAHLVRQDGPITLQHIATSIVICGVTRSASNFAEDLVSAGIWLRNGSIYSFEHEIWNTYFLAVAMQTDSAWRTPEHLAKWIEETPIPLLMQILPFASGLICDQILQRTLFDSLMRRDLELYLRCLRDRVEVTTLRTLSESERIKHVLTELYSGYINLIDLYVPALKPWLDPWCLGDGAELERGEKVVLGGNASKEALRFYWGFGLSGSPNVAVEKLDLDDSPRHSPKKGWSVHGIWLGEDLREDSGRLVGARKLFDQIKKIVTKGQLPPVGWIGRERFRSLTKDLGWGGFLGKDWEDCEVNSICDWTAENLAKAGDSELIILAGGEWHLTNSMSNLRELVTIGTLLVSDGLGKTSLKDLGLPGPDLNPRGGWFSKSYSQKQMFKRVKVLLASVIETYRALCEKYFNGLKDLLFFTQCPVRAVAHLLPDNQYSAACIDVWWEIVEDWKEAKKPIVRVGPQESSFERLANKFQEDCSRLHRPYITCFRAYGWDHWSPWDSAVTEEVKILLSHDIDRISRLMRLAS